MKLSNRIRIAAVISLALLAGVIIAFSYKPSRLILSGWLSGEPCAHGRPLSYWLDALQDYEPGYSDSGRREPRAKQAMEALIAIGPGAAPALRQILLTPDPPNVHDNPEERTFVPRYRAAWCLYRMGEQGRPAFLEALFGRQHFSHCAAVRVLAEERPLPVDLLLEGALAHSNVDKERPLECVSHGGDAWEVLSNVCSPLGPEEVDRLVAAAVNTLGDPDPETRWKATAFLWRVARWSPYSPQREALRPERLEAAARALGALDRDNDASVRVCAAGAHAALEKEHGIKPAK